MCKMTIHLLSVNIYSYIYHAASFWDTRAIFVRNEGDFVVACKIPRYKFSISSCDVFFFEYRRCVFWRSKNFNQLLWHCSFFSFISWHFIKVIINYGIQLVYINNLLLLIKQKLTTGYLLKHMQVCDHFLFLHWNNLNWRINFIKVISNLKI